MLKKALFLIFALWTFAAQANMYLVRDVPVDVTDENATIAREKAVAEAQERAFYLMLKRLTLPSDVSALPILTTEDIQNLVQDYSVAREKTSSVRYIADVSVQFNPDAIQTFFQEYRVPYITSTAEKSLIIPVFKDTDGKTLLWNEKNPWFNVWKKETAKSDLVPLVLPLGDLEDIAVVNEENVARIDMSDLGPLYARYKVHYATIFEAQRIPKENTIKITIKGFQQGRGYMGETSFNTSINAPLDQVLARAAYETVQVLEQKWREKNAVRFDNPSSLITVVPITNLAQWIQIRGQLDNIKRIKQYLVKAVRKDQAQIEIFFAGDLPSFIDSVRREDLFLSPTKGDLWSLRDIHDVSPEELQSFDDRMQIMNTSDAMISKDASSDTPKLEDRLTQDETLSVPNEMTDIGQLEQASETHTGNAGQDAQPETMNIFQSMSTP